MKAYNYFLAYYYRLYFKTDKNLESTLDQHTIAVVYGRNSNLTITYWLRHRRNKIDKEKEVNA